MILTSIDGALLREMITTAAVMLDSQKEKVDALNVFPVPDGDTGTNMSMTMRSAMREVVEEPSNEISALSKAISHGALKGARGNSGVILSQLFRGFCKTVQGEKEITASVFAAALEKGVEMAYKAVMKPREGTILSVSRAVAESAAKAANESDDIVTVLKAALEGGQAMLRRTPEMLDALKQAGVVDSGGMGYIIICQGFEAAILGGDYAAEVEDYIRRESAYAGQEKPEIVSSAAAQAEGDITYGYCTEFILEPLNEGVSEEDVERLRARLTIIGDSLVLVAEENYIKVHVHSNAPGKVLQYALRLGELASVKVENMRRQHSELLTVAEKKEEEPRGKLGVVTVVSGDGIRQVFEELGVTGFVSGGQSMNPSAQDIASAVQAVHCEDVIVFPNNGNIIMAAQQAGQLLEDECRVHVLPTRTIPQGVSASLCLNDQLSVEENLASMQDAVDHVKSGQVTYAVRDSNADGFDIHKDDILGMSEKSILAVGQDITQVVLDVLSGLREDEEVITLYSGEDVAQEDAEALRDEVEARFPDCEVELCAGGQPVYYYLVSLE